MKKAFLLGVIFVFGLILATPAYAACSLDRESRDNPKTVTVNGNSLNVEGRTFDLPASRCTSPQPNGTYTVWCDEASEANAYDSIIVPLCGSSVELSKANSSCWTCGGDYRCAGLSFGLGNSDAFITGIRNPVNPGDTNTDQVWRIRHDQIQVGADGKFLYNGERYTPPNGDLIICNANVLGCGASDLPPDQKCFSTLYPDEEIIDANPDGQEIPPGGTGGRRMEINTLMGTNPGDAITFQSRIIQFASRFDIVQRTLSALIRYADDRHFFAEAIRPIGVTMDASAQYPLMPSMLQQQLSKPYEGEKLPTNYVTHETGWRLCTPGGKIAGRDVENIPLQGLNKSELFIGDGDPDPFFYYKSLWSTQFISSVMGLGVAQGVDYYTPKRNLVPIENERPCFGNICYEVNIDLLDNALYNCDDQTGGPPDQLTITKAAGVAHTGDILGSILDVPVNWIAALFGQLTQCDDKSGKLCGPTTPFLKPTDADGGLISLISQLKGKKRRDFSPKAPAADVNQILEASGGDDEREGGFLRSMWASALPKFRDTNAEVDQQQSLTEGGGTRPVTRGSYPREVAGTVEAFDCVIKNMIVPSDLQKPEDRCTLLDENPSSTQHGNNLPEVPGGISSILDGLRARPDGILGLEFLEKYAQTLITTPLTEAQRALLMARIQELIDRYVANGAWPNSQLGNIDLQNQIREFAAANGFNEAFLYALWIEETHASSVGDYPFGCGGYTDFSSSLDCLANDPTVQTYIRGDLGDALCMYADGHRNCDFTAHPNFVRNLTYYYDYLTTTGSLTP